MNYRRKSWDLLVIAAIYFVAGPLLGQQPKPLPPHWATTAINQARAEFRHFPASRIASTRQEIEESLRATEDWIESTSDEGASPEEWRKKLNLSAVKDWLNQQQVPIEQSLAQLKKITKGLYKNEPGFEADAVVRLRFALGQHGKAIYYASIANLQQEYATRLYQLDASIAQWETEHSEPARRNIGEILAWLEGAELGGSLIAQIRAHFKFPNVRVRTSADFLMRQVKVQRDLSVEEEVETTFEGYTTKGIVTTRATVTPKLTANKDRIDITLQLAGTATAEDNVGVRAEPTGGDEEEEDKDSEEKPNRTTNVTIYTRSDSKLGGTKVIGIDPHSKPHRQPADTWAETEVELKDVVAEGALPRLIAIGARARFARKKEAIEKQASQFAADRFKKLIHSIAPIPLPFFTEVFPQFITKPLDRVGMFPQSMRFYSTEEAAYMSARIAESNRLGSPTEMPEIDANHDVLFQIHESAINNVTIGVYADENGAFSDEVTAAAVKFLTGRIPPETLRLYRGLERWKFVTEADPLTVKCRDGLMDFEFKLSEFRRGDRLIKGPFMVKGTYRPVVGYFGPKFELVSQAEVFAQGTQTRDTLSQEDATFLFDKTTAFFARTLDLVGLLPPAGGSAEALSRLRLSKIYSSGEFLSFGYDEEKESEPELDAAESDSLNAP